MSQINLNITSNAVLNVWLKTGAPVTRASIAAHLKLAPYSIQLRKWMSGGAVVPGCDLVVVPVQTASGHEHLLRAWVPSADFLSFRKSVLKTLNLAV